MHGTVVEGKNLRGSGEWISVRDVKTPPLLGQPGIWEGDAAVLQRKTSPYSKYGNTDGKRNALFITCIPFVAMFE